MKRTLVFILTEPNVEFFYIELNVESFYIEPNVELNPMLRPSILNPKFYSEPNVSFSYSILKITLA